jgi:hypothetical protein
MDDSDESVGGATHKTHEAVACALSDEERTEDQRDMAIVSVYVRTRSVRSL